MAQIGGLYSFFKMIFGPIINAIQHKMMLIDVINKFNRKRLEDSQSRKKIERLEKIFQTQKSRINLRDIPEESKVNDGGEDQYSHTPQYLVDNVRFRNYVNNNIENNTSKTEMMKDIVEYNCADLFYQSLCCFKTKPKKEHFLEENLCKRYDQFTKDLEKFYKETDVFDLIFNI